MSGEWVYAIGIALLGALIIRAGLRILRERTTRGVRFAAGQIKVDLITDFPALLIGIGYVVFGIVCILPLGQVALAALQNETMPAWSQLLTLPLAGFVGLFIFVVVIGLLAGLLTRR
jgi:hypothetical protein